jgi:hypothetical protein
MNVYLQILNPFSVDREIIYVVHCGNGRNVVINSNSVPFHRCSLLPSICLVMQLQCLYLKPSWKVESPNTSSNLSHNLSSTSQALYWSHLEIKSVLTE